MKLSQALRALLMVALTAGAAAASARSMATLDTGVAPAVASPAAAQQGAPSAASEAALMRVSARGDATAAPSAWAGSGGTLLAWSGVHDSAGAARSGPHSAGTAGPSSHTGSSLATLLALPEPGPEALWLAVLAVVLGLSRRRT